MPDYKDEDHDSDFIWKKHKEILVNNLGSQVELISEVILGKQSFLK